MSDALAPFIQLTMVPGVSICTRFKVESPITRVLTTSNPTGTSRREEDLSETITGAGIKQYFNFRPGSRAGTSWTSVEGFGADGEAAENKEQTVNKAPVVLLQMCVLKTLLKTN